MFARIVAWAMSDFLAIFDHIFFIFLTIIFENIIFSKTFLFYSSIILNNHSINRREILTENSFVIPSCINFAPIKRRNILTVGYIKRSLL